jgi:transposase, IS30 family
MQDSMKPYHRLSFQEREEMSRGIVEGLSLRSIAHQLGRHPSTLCREIQRGESREKYRAWSAQRITDIHKHTHHCSMKITQNIPLREYVLSKLHLLWSPVQIAQSLKKEYPWDTGMQISHESIYTYLYVLPRGTLRQELISCLRQARKVRLKRRKKDRFYAPKITNMISIEERPDAVSNRTIPGHWEGDIILGTHRQSCLGTLVERTTRSVLLVPLTEKKAPTVRKAFEKEIRTIPKHLRKTLTYDQGTEMAEHRLFEKHTRMKVYFAHPSSPWERGTNENTNGLIRQFFPKNTDFTTISRRQIKRAQRLLNERPRKVLNWRTPKEVLTELLR